MASRMSIIDETEKAKLEDIPPVKPVPVEAKTGPDGETKKRRGRPPGSKNGVKNPDGTSSGGAAKPKPPMGKITAAIFPPEMLPIAANIGFYLTAMGVHRRLDVVLPPPPQPMLDMNTDNLKLLLQGLVLEMHPGYALLIGNAAAPVLSVGMFLFEKWTRPTEEVIEKRARAMAEQMAQAAAQAAQQANGVSNGVARDAGGNGTSAATDLGSSGSAAA